MTVGTLIYLLQKYPSDLCVNIKTLSGQIEILNNDANIISVNDCELTIDTWKTRDEAIREFDM